MSYAAIIGLLLVPLAGAQQWEVHDLDRPQPDRAVVVGVPGAAPSDAIVLFDGTDLSAWSHEDGADARWTVKEGYFEVAAGEGSIQTRSRFGDVQLHVEWFVPESEEADDGQLRGNSGVFLMGLYEIQVLESTGGTTYPDGMNGAIYGQRPPLVNAAAGIGRWNAYDIIFRAPEFDGEDVVHPATTTVFHNGVLIHDNFEFEGRARHAARTSYEPHEPQLPIKLQDHTDPVRFRNVWVRPLDPRGSYDRETWLDLFPEGGEGDSWFLAFGDADGDGTVSIGGREVRILHDWDQDTAPNGFICTKEAYSSYDLEMEVRWGERRFTSHGARNSGLLFHITEADTVWPRCVEFQMMQGSAGDTYAIGGTSASVVRTGEVAGAEGESRWAPRWAGDEHDGWNRVRLEVRGDHAWYYLNGRLVQELDRLRTADGPLTSGMIGLQIEGAEVSYRNVRLRPVE